MAKDTAVPAAEKKQRRPKAGKRITIGPNSNTAGEAWKRCAAQIQELAVRNEAKG